MSESIGAERAGIDIKEGLAAETFDHRDARRNGPVAGFGKAFGPDADGNVIAHRRDGGAGRELELERGEPGAARVTVRPETAVNLGGEEIHARRTEEAGDEAIGRAIVELERGADLLDDAVVEHDDAARHGHGLGLVVGDVDHGGLELGVEPPSSTRICERSAASRLESGSSNRKTSGERVMARPMATRCFWPPDSCLGFLSRCSVMRRISAARWTALSISALGRPAILRAKPMFSRTLMCG